MDLFLRLKDACSLSNIPVSMLLLSATVQGKKLLLIEIGIKFQFDQLVKNKSRITGYHRTMNW